VKGAAADAIITVRSLIRRADHLPVGRPAGATAVTSRKNSTASKPRSSSTIINSPAFEPGACQQRPGLLEEPERARRVQLHQGRRRLAQRGLQLAEQPRGRALPGQQLLHRAAAAEPASSPGLDVGGGHHQAGILGELQRELDPPGTGIRTVRLSGRVGFDQPEAGAHRPRGYQRAEDHSMVPRTVSPAHPLTETRDDSVTWLTQEAYDRLKAELDHLS
jgi:hypothetical protein